MPSLPFIFLFLLMGLSPASAQGGSERRKSSRLARAMHPVFAENN